MNLELLRKMLMGTTASPEADAPTSTAEFSAQASSAPVGPVVVQPGQVIKLNGKSQESSTQGTAKTDAETSRKTVSADDEFKDMVRKLQETLTKRTSSGSRAAQAAEVETALDADRAQKLLQQVGMATSTLAKATSNNKVNGDDFWKSMEPKNAERVRASQKAQADLDDKELDNQIAAVGLAKNFGSTTDGTRTNNINIHVDGLKQTQSEDDKYAPPVVDRASATQAGVQARADDRELERLADKVQKEFPGGVAAKRIMDKVRTSKTLPGVGAIEGGFPTWLKSPEGQTIMMEAQTLYNSHIKGQSGSAVSGQEFERMKTALGIMGAAKTEHEFKEGMRLLEESYKSTLNTLYSGRKPKTVQTFSQRSGLGVEGHPGGPPPKALEDMTPEELAERKAKLMQQMGRK